MLQDTEGSCIARLWHLELDWKREQGARLEQVGKLARAPAIFQRPEEADVSICTVVPVISSPSPACYSYPWNPAPCLLLLFDCLFDCLGEIV